MPSGLSTAIKLGASKSIFIGRIPRADLDRERRADLRRILGHPSTLYHVKSHWHDRKRWVPWYSLGAQFNLI